MKVLGVSGSPRKDGNSDVATKTILEILRDLGETEFIRIADYTISVVSQPKLSFANAKVALVTVAAENGFELHNEFLSRWLRVHDAQVVGSIDVYASEKNDLVQDRSQIAKLKEFASEIIGKVN